MNSGTDTILREQRISPAGILESLLPPQAKTQPITVVDLKFRDLCYMAMRLGMDIATGRASYPQEISLHPTIIYRKSCPA